MALAGGLGETGGDVAAPLVAGILLPALLAEFGAEVIVVRGDGDRL